MKRKPRLYGLFEKREGKWVRLCPTLAWPKSLAVNFFQDALLAYPLGECSNVRELRPVKE